MVTYVQWGRQHCTNGHELEYNGLVMGPHYSQRRSESVCVDYARQGHAKSDAGNQDGGLLYTTEMQGGSADEAAYPHDLEVGCAVCSAPLGEGSVYPRWGSQECPSGVTTLYSGFMSSSHYGHNGGGANTLCMHPQGQLPQGASSADQNGNLLYGMEYQNSGAADASHDVDAGCAMCLRPGARQTYVQWGRQECTNGHTTEYNGLVMGTHYSQHKSEHVCVDYARMGHAASNAGNQDGGLLYTTEMQGGSADEAAYPHDLEVGCAVCSVPESQGSVYPRWGNQECPSGVTTLYSGFMSGSHYSHRGSGANTLCMHPQGQTPQGASAGNQNGNLLYGMEYQNTGGADASHDVDAACAMCQRPGPSS